jgi:excisionase family DNA binding protein
VSSDRKERVASLGWDGRVSLGPDGVRVALLALEMLKRSVRANGGGAPSADAQWLAEVLKAAEGFVPATPARSFTLVMPSSEPGLTVTEAARIRGVSPQAIRKAIRAGRLPATRHGGSWLLSETDVRTHGPARQSARGRGDD